MRRNVRSWWIPMQSFLVFTSLCGLAAGEGFGIDMKAGSRTHDVGHSGAAQWLADVNGDGRGDLIYNWAKTKQYWVLLADGTLPHGSGKFQADKQAGCRKNSVGVDGQAQWMADINGDGRADYGYNRQGTNEYWVMLATQDGTFEEDKKAGSRADGNNVGTDGKAQWLADVNGDGRADLVYSRKDTNEYWVMLATTDGAFEKDKKAGSRADGTSVGFDGKGQWLADVNGDGRADLVYSRKDTKEYWILLAKDEGTFENAKSAGDRDNDVGVKGKAQWLIDLTSDGRADYVYNRATTNEYWVMEAQEDGTFQLDKNWGGRNRSNNVANEGYSQGFGHLNEDGLEDFLYNRSHSGEYWTMLSLGDSFKVDQLWGERNNPVGDHGRSAFLGDINGDGLDDVVYNRNGTSEEWVMLSKRSLDIAHINLLDVWGEGFIRMPDGMITGFQDSYNLNMKTQLVSNGPNSGKSIPRLVPVKEFDEPVFPIEDGGVNVMTIMGAPITPWVAREMYRTLEKNKGAVILFGYADGEDLENFERVFVTQHGFHDVTDKSTLGYPYNQISLVPARVYTSRNMGVKLSLGKGGRVGGAAMSDSQQNELSGGGLVKDEL